MESFRLAYYEALWLLWLVLALIGLIAWSFYRKKKLLEQFAASDMLKHINRNVSFRRQLLKWSLLLLAVVAIVLALAQPGWNPKPERIERKGRDVVVLLDVSRSMLAEDLAPNRLERAKIFINDLINVLDGDRIGIITFAGKSMLKCPLTQDYGFARLALADIDIQSVGMRGTNIGDAIRMATNEVFDKTARDFKDIILITDGDDHDSFPEDAAAKAGEEGIRIFAIGLGDEKEGKRIPITGPDGKKIFLKYQGQEVWSKLGGDTLREIAMNANGRYFPVGTGTIELDKIYQKLNADAEEKKLESTTVMRYDEKFQIFLALALMAVMAESVISERKKVSS